MNSTLSKAFTLALLTFSLHRADAAVTFAFDFTDAPGVGFNAAGQTGADRRAGLQQAANIVADLFVNYNATVNLSVNGSETNDSTLASAGSNFNFTPGNGFGGRGDVGIIILGGADPNPAAPDGTVNWNFEDFTWEPLNDFQPGEQDLISTAAHELLHAVGFSSDIQQNGNNGYGATPGNSAIWAPFDQFVSDSTGALIDGTTFALDGARWNTASVGGAGTTPAANGLYFNGANAMAANGGNPVPLYSPTTWAGGSSGSHLDTDFFTGSNVKMMNHEAAVASGLDIRTIDVITRNMLKDIGFDLIVVPEPSSSLLILLGTTSLLFRRQRR